MALWRKSLTSILKPLASLGENLAHFAEQAEIAAAEHHAEAARQKALGDAEATSAAGARKIAEGLAALLGTKKKRRKKKARKKRKKAQIYSIPKTPAAKPLE